jgi:hypothetical protein
MRQVLYIETGGFISKGYCDIAISVDGYVAGLNQSEESRSAMGRSRNCMPGWKTMRTQPRSSKLRHPVRL